MANRRLTHWPTQRRLPNLLAPFQGGGRRFPPPLVNRGHRRRSVVSCHTRGRAMAETVMREAMIIAIACFLILTMAAALIIHFVQ